LAFFGKINFYVSLTDLKKILADFWRLEEFWTLFRDKD